MNHRWATDKFSKQCTNDVRRPAISGLVVAPPPRRSAEKTGIKFSFGGLAER